MLVFDNKKNPKGSKGLEYWVFGEGCSGKREQQVQKPGGRMPAKVLSSSSHVLIQFL